jgi:hypothetical protein
MPVDGVNRLGSFSEYSPMNSFAQNAHILKQCAKAKARLYRVIKRKLPQKNFARVY